jgi:hypothetical protein
MKKFFLLIVSIAILNTGWAQDEDSQKAKPSTPSPDFPGALLVEYGLNYFYENSNEMRTNPWRSSTINVYYTYPVKLGKSRFSFNPGVGVGSEKFGFEDQVSFLDSANQTVLKPIAELARFDSTMNFKRTQFVANYIDIPMEFRIHSRKSDHKRSFFLAVGGKIGFNFDAKTKIIYQEFGKTKTYKDKYNWNVNSVRYGATARIGYGPLNVWFYYSGSKLFRGNRTVNMVNPSMWSWGISLATF